MSFNVYDSTGLAVNQLGQESPAIFSKYFELQECTNITTDVLNDPNMASHFNSLMHISGVATVPPQIAYSTTWTNGPHSVLANKVNDLFKNDVFKMFASANPRYRPILLTDAWTQQYPKEGKKLSTSIAFRSYPIYQYNTSNYYEIFKLLFYCSAPKHYGFGDNIDFVMDAIEKSMVTGTEFGKIFGGMIDDFKTFTKDKNLHFTKQDLTDFDKELKENDTNPDKASLVLNFNKNANGTDTKKKLIHSAATLVALLESFCQNTETACPRFMLKYGDLYNANGYGYWVISGWSCKPCVQTTIENGKVCPLFIDFTINLQTAGKIGTTDLTGILNGTPGTLDEITKKSIETANDKSAKETLFKKPIFKQKPIK